MMLSVNSLDCLKAFLGGVALSFSPCVYPLIPLTAGYIGIGAAGSRLRGFLLSFVYVTGMAFSYSALGLLASLGGTLFGRISASPIVHILVGVVILLFAFSMLDLFTLALPQVIRMPALKKKNYFSAFIFGMVSGLMISPCLTPVLGAILFYLAVKQNILYGVTLLVSFAYGMGLILMLVGFFSTLLVNLPRSGRWMLYIKRACALVLLGMGLYFIAEGINQVRSR
jgi:thiol:disulfide interchange protein DsbD